MQVTIGLPVYNAAPTLPDTLRAIFAQTLQDWELIIVDDGSSDASLEIARAVTDPRVRVLSDGKNLGLPARLNQIAQAAQGGFLARMDADDLMHPERLARQIAYLMAHPEVDVVDTAMCLIDNDYQPLGLRGTAALDRSPEAVLHPGWLLHASIVARTTWFRRNPYDATFLRAEDHELWCRTWGTTRFDRLPEALYYVRDEESFTLAKYLASARTDRRIIRQYGPALVGRGGTVKHLLRSWMKGEIYRVLTGMHQEGRLIHRRYAEMPQDARLMATHAMERILRTAVPGLSQVEPAATVFA